jgi:cell wall-associated NlpC family hydrolase
VEVLRRSEASAPILDDTLSALRLRALQHSHHASPNNQDFPRTRGRFSGRGLLTAFCLFVFAFGVGDLADAQTPSANPRSAKKAASDSAPAKSKPNTKAKKPLKKAPVAPSNVKRDKPAPPPVVIAKTKTKAESITQKISPTLPENIEQEISKFFGLRYRFGGNGQGGIDCSGLVQKVYADAFGVELPRSSREQSQLGDLETVAGDELKTGDLLFFGPQRKRIDHVGMYLSGGYFLHAARSEGVTISRLDHQHWKARFMFSKRIRGLEIEDSSQNSEMEELARNSAAFAFSGLESGGLLSSMDAGIRLDDSFELILSGFFLNALSDPPPPEPGSLFADHMPRYAHPPTESGLKLSALLSPLEWVGILPSISQAEGSRSKEKSALDEENYQKIGLETWMVLPSSRVAMFMAAHVNNQENLLDNPARISPDWQSLDVALGLHYKLSDSLRFSLYSTHAYSQDSRLSSDEAGRSKLTLEDVGIRLNIRF